MPGLSIVIPTLGDLPALENGLVSVLANRPHDSEVLVVLNQAYDDPYDLADEVRFVQAAHGANWAESVNQGVNASRGSVVHVLGAGVEVDEGWSDAALAHFRDLRVAAVAPVVRERSRSRTVAAGIEYRAGGRAVLRRRAPATPEATPVLGPAAIAGFYRRSVLELVGGFEAGLGDLAGVDLALQCRYLGFRAMLEPGSQVIAAPAGAGARHSGYQAGLAAERLFMRNAAVLGWRKSMALHSLAIGGQFLRTTPWSALAQLAGRIKAWTELSRVRQHQTHLVDLRLKDLMDMTRPLSGRRTDAAHAGKFVGGRVPRSKAG